MIPSGKVHGGGSIRPLQKEYSINKE